MKTSQITATVGLLLILALPCALKAAVFNVKNSPYNATGNGVTNDWSAINNAIQAAVSAGPGSVVEIPGGTNVYYLGTSSSLTINNANGITVQGDSPNSLLINGTTADVFHIDNSSNIVVQNLALDTRPVRFTQGTITAIASGGKSMTVTVDAGFQALNAAMFTNASSDEVCFWTDPNCLAYDKTLTGNILSNATFISGSSWTVNLNSAIPTNEVGNKFAIWNDGGGWAMNLTGNTGPITVSNFVYYGGGSGATVGMYKNLKPILLSHVTTGPPAGSGRLISAGGGYDAQGDRCPITFDTVSVSRTETDTLDIGTDLAHILSTNSSTQIVVEPTETYQPGDTVQIWDWTYQNQHVRQTATITAVSTNGSGNIVLTFSAPVTILHTGAGPGDTDWSGQEMDGIDRCVCMQDASPGTVITNCNFQTSGRTFNMKASSCTIVSNNFFQTPWNIFSAAETFWHGGPAPLNLSIIGNTFNDVDIAPVEVEVRYSRWPASCSNILVAGNTFIGCGAHEPFSDGVYGPQIDVRGAGVCLRNVNTGTISNNTFYGIWGPPVVLQNCTNIQVLNNNLIECHQQHWSDWSNYQCDMGADVTMTNCGTVTLSGNVTYGEGTNLDTYISATNCSNITGLTTGVSVGSTTFSLPSGTVGFWPFTNSSNLGADISGQGNTLQTASGLPSYSSDGEFVGGSLYLDGSSTLEALSGLFPSGVPTGNSAFTIAVWEKAGASCPANGGFVGWGDNASGEANDLRLNGLNSVDDYWFANDFTVSDLGVNPLDGNWHAIAVTWDGTTETMYVDGVSVGTRTPTTPNVQAANFIVGKTTADVDFQGCIQNLLIANVALTAAQIASYQTGFTTFTPPNTNAVVSYKANAITGVSSGSKLATWDDSSGNGNNATQTVSGNQPTYVTNAMSGLPVVRFNSADSTYMSFARPVSNDFTMTFVYQSSQGIGTGTQFYQGAGLVNGEVAGVTDDFGTSLNTNGYLLAGTGNPDTTITSGTGFNDGRPHVVTFERTMSTGALALYVDGTQVSTGTGGTQSLTAPSQLVLGAQQTLNNYLSGDIAEVQIFDTALSDTQRQALESGLMSEYAVGLPSPWQSQDINASLPGGASYSNGVFMVEGSGSDIYNTADQFRYVYQSGSGDCSVLAEIDSVSNTDMNAKGAVMIRETLNADSMMAAAIVNPGGGVQFIWRNSTGGSAVATTAVGVSFPIWLKVTRSGNSFSGYYSSDGSTWTQMGSSQTISMASATQIGLAVTSHNTSKLCTTVFNNVTASP